MRKTAAIFCALCLAGAGLRAADLYQWELAGPGGGGRFTLPALSPDGRRMLSSSDMGNTFYGEAASGAMEMIPQKLQSFTAGDGFFFNPGRPGEVYAGSTIRGLRKSTDWGRSWEPVALPIEKLEWNGSWPPPYSGPVLGHFNGSNGAIVYFRYEKSGRNPVFSTADGGESWKLLGMLPADSKRPRGVAAAADGGVLIVQEDAVRRIGPGGALSELFVPKDGALVALAEFEGKLYLAVNGKAGAEVLVSADGGAEWKPAAALGKGTAFRYMKSGAGANPAIYFVASMPGKVTEEDPRGSTVCRTSDGFKSFRPMLFRNAAGSKFNISNRQWTSSAWGWQQIPQGLAVAADDGDVIMCTDPTQAYLSTDGGKSWRCLAAPSAAEDPERTLTDGAMAVMSAYGYCFDPNNRDNRYIAMNDFSNWASFDGGASWKQYNEGNPFPHNVYTMLFDPEVPGRIWAGASKDHDLPHWKWQNSNNKLTNLGTLITSDDGGKTWRAAEKESGLPVGTITGLVMDPASQAGSRTLLAAVYGRGIYKSTDGGRSWSDSSNGISKWDRNLFRLLRDAHGRLWAVGSVRLPGMLYRSSDNGENWEKVFQKKEFGYLTGFAADPKNPETLYLSAFSTRPFHDSDGGVKKSTDGGKNWKTVLPGRACWGVYVHPATPDIVFAATYDSGLFRSADGGESWELLGNYPAPSPIAVTFDPVDPDTVYVGNYGASVYRGTLK